MAHTFMHGATEIGPVMRAHVEVRRLTAAEPVTGIRRSTAFLPTSDTNVNLVYEVKLGVYHSENTYIAFEAWIAGLATTFASGPVDCSIEDDSNAVLLDMDGLRLQSITHPTAKGPADGRFSDEVEFTFLTTTAPVVPVQS